MFQLFISYNYSCCLNNISKILHFALVRSHLKYKFQSLFRAAEEFEPDP